MGFPSNLLALAALGFTIANKKTQLSGGAMVGKQGLTNSKRTFLKSL
jgi:hypothetical protein